MKEQVLQPAGKAFGKCDLCLTFQFTLDVVLALVYVFHATSRSCAVLFLVELLRKSRFLHLCQCSLLFETVSMLSSGVC